MSPTPHLSRLSHALRQLLWQRRTGALATLDHASGAPWVSMVPFAIDTRHACLVLHLSGLAAHTANLVAEPRASLLVMAAETPGAPVLDLPRVSIAASAVTPPADSAAGMAARAAYLARFPEAEPITQLPDFRFVTLRPDSARQVDGFGSARTVDADELARLLSA